MSRKIIDSKIIDTAIVMNTMISLETAAKTSKDPKQIDKFNAEFEIRYKELQGLCIELNNMLDAYFIFEKQNNLPQDFSLRQVKKQITGFLS